MVAAVEVEEQHLEAFLLILNWKSTPQHLKSRESRVLMRNIHAENRNAI